MDIKQKGCRGIDIDILFDSKRIGGVVDEKEEEEKVMMQVQVIIICQGGCRGRGGYFVWCPCP